MLEIFNGNEFYAQYRKGRNEKPMNTRKKFQQNNVIIKQYSFFSIYYLKKNLVTTLHSQICTFKVLFE